MADVKRKHDWDQTSMLWATIANTARDPKKQPAAFKPDMVHPYRSEKDYKPKPIKADITVLKALLKK